jgi:hypothetical protein
MSTRRHLALGFALLGLGGGLACGGGSGSTGPTAGTATVSLVTPNADDGAVLLTLTGPNFANVVSASASYHAYVRTVSPGEVRVILVGDLAAGVVLTTAVDDVSKIGQYGGTVAEAASRSDVVRSSTAGYGVTFAKQ